MEVFSLYKNVYQFTSTVYKAPDNIKVHTPVHVYGFSVWNSLNVTLLVTRILRWLLGFRQICKTLINNQILMFLSLYAKQKVHNYYTILCCIVFCEHVHFDGPHDTVESKLHEIDPLEITTRCSFVI